MPPNEQTQAPTRTQQPDQVQNPRRQSERCRETLVLHQKVQNRRQAQIRQSTQGNIATP
ncbi:uncharacterized protein EI90DRAFT_3081176, partial [Cantharellus anzutake]|uniref:uncharacterized protein n=1 Tax=Cantharellus anzutake TaxID=1750568 RepID=UPI001903A9BD